MDFTKMHGLGNDFILVEDLERTFKEARGPALAKALCARRTGIGADGLILIRRGEAAPLRMRLFNSDGSLADMCGNGIRCFARYAYDRALVREPAFDVETDAGLRRAELILSNGGDVEAVRIGMGRPLLARQAVPMLGDGQTCRLEPIQALGKAFTVSAVNTGVPHLVVFLHEPMGEEDILRYGTALEKHPAFPKRVNVNFVEVLSPERLRTRTFERGAGRTLACGTGACASLVCAAEAGYTGRTANVELALGRLYIEWVENGELYMSGPAAYSFAGSVEA